MFKTVCFILCAFYHNKKNLSDREIEDTVLDSVEESRNMHNSPTLNSLHQVAD